MKKADVNEAVIAMIFEQDLWEIEGKVAEKTLTYIAGIIDFAERIRELCDD